MCVVYRVKSDPQGFTENSRYADCLCPTLHSQIHKSSEGSAQRAEPTTWFVLESKLQMEAGCGGDGAAAAAA